jgi:hypothetical protein
MNRSALRRFIFVLSLAIPALLAGCNRHVANGKPVIAKSTPEERFNNILESFRHKIEGQPVGFVVAEGGSRTTMMGTNTVTSELIRPETADGHFKAVITVASESRYSVRRSKTAEESERDKNSQNKNKSSSALDDPKKKQGIGILEPDLAQSSHSEPSSSATKPQQPAEDIVTRRPNEDIRKYELVDDGDRWVLITKPDPKTEQSIEFAFSEALAHQ